MRKELTNAVVERFNGGGRYQSGKHKGELKPHDVLWDTKEPGFGVRYSMKTGVRTYIYQRRVKGTSTDRTITIGRHGERCIDREGKIFLLDVNHARNKATKLRLMMTEDRIDPVEEQRRKREAEKQRQAEEARLAELERAQGTTLRQVLEHFLVHRTLRPRTRDDYRYHCENNLAAWLDEPVATITRELCSAKFTEITDRGAKGQANLCMVYLRSLLNHAREMHFNERTGEYPVLPFNPVTLMIKLRKGLNEEVPRETRIPLEKVGAVWLELQRRREAARTIDNRTAVDWTCFMMLTGCRLTESASLKWTDVDLEAKTFTLRREVVKNHNGVTLPMSTVLHEIVSARRSPLPENEKAARRRRVQRASEYVFASYGQKTPYITSAPATFGAISRMAGTRVSRHDLRRTFVDIATECGIGGDQQRLLVNHKSGDVHSVAYANNKKALAGAVEAIATWVTTQAKIAAGANVVPLRDSARTKTG